MQDKHNWTDAEENNVKDKDFYKDGYFLKTDLGFFVVQPTKSTGFFDNNKPNEAYLSFYKDISDIDNNKPPFYIKTINSVDTAKNIAESTNDYINNNKNIKLDNVKEHIDSSIENRKNLFQAFANSEKEKYESSFSNGNSNEIEIARKAGYVQGVCECVAAIGDDHALGKKLLSEMNVNRDMAKKYANPETFKTLEQGIFAQKPERKQELEQTQGFKL